MGRATYVYDAEQGRMVHKETRAPMVSGEFKPVLPQVVSDTPGYRSPVDGRWVEGRRQRRYDLESNGCIDANDLPNRPQGFKNERFAKKYNLPMKEE